MSELVVHLSPTYFSPDSIIGGGERYAEELSRAMSLQVNVRFVSFGPQEIREKISPTFERIILKTRTAKKMTPFSEGLLGVLRGATVIHCHQYYVLPTFIAALFGRFSRKKIFISDLGGSGWTPAYRIDQSRWIEQHLPISLYAAKRLPGTNRQYTVIYGGVDTSFHTMRKEQKHDGSVVFLGRILPHKGVHYLIDGLPDDIELKIIGPVDDNAYLERLKRGAKGKKVTFLCNLSDGEIADHLRIAMALVHPTPVDENGDAGINELFGLAPVEAMASGCVPVLSAAASLPELIQDGISGMLVQPNKPMEIWNALQKLQKNPELWRKLSLEARDRVEKKFTWQQVVHRCFDAYGMDRW